MRKEEVPQDEDLINAGLRKDIYYALDENGEFVQVLSTGWDAKNTVILQAWEAVQEGVEAARQAVLRGEASPLLYHIRRCQMDVKLLSDYTGFSKSKIRRHCTPRGFKKISYEEVQCYARALGIKPEQLYHIPDA
ncbi:MAG: hypothetical protein N2110_05960 [Flavobacteriales bacterium]|nr:hypothetical protein [Flavobacteriales bacterium]MCX7768549.1 hypothetical protein [Flavobacteriales bacterium]MDW8409482.1 hypothetical protein [Flavobacteriales bacterium]